MLQDLFKCVRININVGLRIRFRCGNDQQVAKSFVSANRREARNARDHVAVHQRIDDLGRRAWQAAT